MCEPDISSGKIVIYQYQFEDECVVLPQSLQLAVWMLQKFSELCNYLVFKTVPAQIQVFQMRWVQVES